MSSRKHHSPLCERRQLVRGTNRLSSPTQHFRKHTVSARLSEFPTYEICRSFPSGSRGSRNRERSAARPEAKCGPPLPAPSRLPRGPRGPAPRAPPPPAGRRAGRRGRARGRPGRHVGRLLSPGCVCASGAGSPFAARGGGGRRRGAARRAARGRGRGSWTSRGCRRR